MGSVVISHLIGTVSILVLFTIVATSYTINYSNLQLEILAYNLQGISEYVSAETLDLVSLCSISPQDQFIFKKLEVPEKVSLEAYNITITPSQGLLKVVANVSLTVYGEAFLPWSAEGNIKLYNGTNPGVTDTRISLNKTLESYRKNLIVWCLKKEDNITFGLGYLKGG